jgi:hypothetical protein
MKKIKIEIKIRNSKIHNISISTTAKGVRIGLKVLNASRR